MTREEAVNWLENKDFNDNPRKWEEALRKAIEALNTVAEFEKAQIITGGRLNGRTYAYKCGLEDGKRKALQQEPCEDMISRKHLLSEIDDLMGSPWFNRYRDDCGALHFGYIERKEAVEIVRDVCVKTEPPVQPKVVPIAEVRSDDDKLHEIVGEAIKNIEIKPKWIPVSERLPGCGQRVLTSGMIRPFDERCKIRIATFYDGEFWPLSGDVQILSGVRAWMPLPEPYKVESEDV